MQSAVWPLRDGARAAGMKPRALRQKFDTGLFKLTGCDRQSTGSGSRCGLSRRRVLQAAITEKLTQLGFSPSRAARAAFEFSDSGNVGRQPAELFDHDRTILLIRPDGATVKNVPITASFADIKDGEDCHLMVDLNAIVKRVDYLLNTTERNDLK